MHEFYALEIENSGGGRWSVKLHGTNVALKYIKYIFLET